MIYLVWGGILVWDFLVVFLVCFGVGFFFLFCGGGYVSFFLIGVFGWGFLVLFFGSLGSFSSVF